ncbi:hypothetical protein K1T71_011047 [Dendrolimus kikuchii]|uniref:Uncharacterized protein n=1 Tax=Dendrolimus kikuchii TaxID=765133 RepID=A0ACC1CMX0_9NEOP|nr:hypothetical protein K1T71_011047 [Dendrolimus kikuchii]
MPLDLEKPITLEAEYKKKTGITPDDIKKLRTWLSTQPHLPANDITDLDLILTFHCCDKSAEVTKQVLDLNLTLKTLFTNLFKDRHVTDKLMTSLSYYLFAPLETRTYDDSKIYFCKLMEPDTKVFVFSDAIKLVLMVLDLWQYLQGTWPGLVIVIDMNVVTLAHITKLDIQTIQQFLYFLQEALLVKLKGLHFINAPSFMDRLMMLLRPFMKKELMDMLVIHQTGSKTIDKYLPMEALPKEAGGQYKTFDTLRTEIIEIVRANSDFFVEEHKKRVVESLRPGKPKTITDIFGGIEGSFKKLDID